MIELTARLDPWFLAHIGTPADVYVLVGRVAGHDRLRTGHIATTSPVRFMAADFSFAFTSSQGRRYHLGTRKVPSVLALRILCSTLWAWDIADAALVRCDVDPSEMAGRHLIVTDG